MYNLNRLFWLEVVYVIVATNAFTNSPTSPLQRHIGPGGEEQFVFHHDPTTLIPRFHGWNSKRKLDTGSDSKDFFFGFKSYLHSLSSRGNDLVTGNAKEQQNPKSTSAQKQPQRKKKFIAQWSPNGIVNGLYNDETGSEPHGVKIMYDRLLKQKKGDGETSEIDIPSVEEDAPPVKDVLSVKDLPNVETIPSTIQAELSDLEKKASAFETLYKDLELNMTQALSDNKKTLEEINETWEKKYTTQIKSLTDEKDRALAEVEQKVSLLKMEKNRVEQLEKKCKDLENSLSHEVENKELALRVLECKLTSKYEVEMEVLKDWAKQNATELNEYKKTIVDQIAQIEKKKEEEKTRFEKEVSRLMRDLNAETRQTLSVTRELKNAKKHHGTLRQKIHKEKQRTIFALRKSREKSSEEKKKMSQDYSDEIKALVNASKAKEAKLEMERDYALLQLYSVQMLNERLQAEMTNKTQELEQQIVELKDSAAEEISRLERNWESQMKDLREMTKEEITKIETAAEADKLLIRNEWSDKVKNTEEKGRKEIEKLKILNEKHLKNITSLQVTINESRLKEEILEKEIKDALVQLNAVKLSNEKLQTEMNNKTQILEAKIIEKQKEGEKVIATLEKEWASRLNAVEKMSTKEVNKLKEEAKKAKHTATGQLSDDLKKTKEVGRKELELLKILNEEQLKNITSLQAFVDKSKTKEKEIENERDDALVQLKSYRLLNEKLEAEIKNKTQHWEEETSELKENAEKKILSLEKKWATRLSAAEEVAANELKKVEEKAEKEKFSIRNEWSNKLKATKEEGRREIEKYEQQLASVKNLEKEQSTGVRKLSKQILKVLADRSVSVYKKVVPKRNNKKTISANVNKSRTAVEAFEEVLLE